jgi:Zn-finger nucleic acid-binding protein
MPFVFGLMFVGSKFCFHCGAIAAPIDVELDEGSGSDCPRCRREMERLHVGDTSLSGCPRCDGLWMDAATFEAICADRERQSAVLGFLDGHRTQPLPLTKVNYVPCPDCGQLMNRNNFAKASGVIVDICKQHGVWFDADELPAIVRFVQKGGMEHARKRELAEIKDERSRLRDEQGKQGEQDTRHGIGALLNDHQESGIRVFVKSLFG